MFSVALVRTKGSSSRPSSGVGKVKVAQLALTVLVVVSGVDPVKVALYHRCWTTIIRVQVVWKHSHSTLADCSDGTGFWAGQ